MSKYNRLVKNTGLILIGSAGSRFLQFLLLPFCTAYLSPAEYGVKELLVVYATIFISLVGCKLEDSVFLFATERPKEEQASYFSTGLLCITGAYLFGGCLFALYEKWSGGAGFFAEHWPLIFVFALLMGYYGLLQELCRSTNRLAVYSISEICYTLGVVGGAFVLIPQYGINGYIAAICMGYFLAVVYLFFALRLWSYLVRPEHFSAIAIKMYRFSLPIVPTGIMWWVISSLNRPLLERYDTIAGIGIFAIANKIPQLLDSVWLVFFNTWQISVMEEFRKPGFVRYFNRVGDLLLECFVLGGCLLSITAPWYVRLLLGEAYRGTSLYIPLLTFGILFSILIGFTGTIFTASQRSVYFFHTSMIALAAALLLNVVLIPRHGIWGAVFALTLTSIIQFLARWYFASKLVATRDVLKKAGMVSGFAMIVAAFYWIENHYLQWGIYLVVLGLVSRQLQRDARPFLRHNPLSGLLAKIQRKMEIES